MNLQVIVDNISLDIPANARMQVVRTNAMLQAGESSNTRSTQITLPYTPNNVRAFGFQLNFNVDPRSTLAKGAKIRKCAIIIGGVVSSGVLYMVSVSSSGFVVALTWGNDFKELKDTTLRESLGMLDVMWRTLQNSGFFHKYTYNNGNRYKFYTFEFGRAMLNLPSVVYDIDEDIEERWQNVCLLLNEYKGADKFGVVLDIPQSVEAGSIFNVTDGKTAYGVMQSGTSAEGEVSWAAVQTERWRCKYTTEIQFPNDFPDDVFMVNVRNIVNFENVDPESLVTFYGDYAFDLLYKQERTTQKVARNVTGQPLAGRKIKLNAYDAFTFIRQSDYYNEVWEHVIAGTTYYEGYFGVKQVSGYYGAEIKATQEIDAISIIEGGSDHALPAIYNVPDWTLGECWQYLCEMCGAWYEITDGVVKVRKREVSGNKVLRDVTKVSKTARKYQNYAQSNVVALKRDGWSGTVVCYDYIMPNESVERVKTLLEVPASGGATRDGRLSVHDIVTYKVLTDEGTTADETQIEDGEMCWCVQRDGVLYQASVAVDLLRVQLLEDCQEVEVQAVMSYVAFMALKQDEGVIFGGARWLWSSARWSEGVVTLTLHRFDEL